MRAHIGTTVTLNTVLRIPYRNIHCDAALLVCGSTGRSCAVHIVFKCRYRQGIAFLCGYFGLNVIDKINCVFSSALCMGHNQAFVRRVLPAVRNLNFNNLLCTCVNRRPVLLDNIVAFTSVSSLCSSFHKVNRLLLRNNSGQFKECRLKDCVNTGRSHAGLDTDLYAVDHIELDVMVRNKCFHLSWQMAFKFFHIPRAVQKERTAVNQFLNHVVLINIGRIMTCYKVRFVDQVCRLDRLLAKAQVGHGYAARLFGVIVKICLRIHIRVVTDNLDGVLVCSYGTVRAKTPELTVGRSFRRCHKRSACVKGKICHIIYDTDREFCLLCVFVHRNDLCRRRIFGT